MIAAVLPALSPSFPGRQPCCRECAAVKTDVRHGEAVGDIGVRLHLSVRVESQQSELAILLLGDQIADALVASEVIVYPFIEHVGYTQLLRAIAEMLDAVPRAETLEPAGVVGVYLAGVSGHCLGHLEDVRAPGMQEVQPQPEIGREL